MKKKSFNIHSEKHIFTKSFQSPSKLLMENVLNGKTKIKCLFERHISPKLSKGNRKKDGKPRKDPV